MVTWICSAENSFTTGGVYPEKKSLLGCWREMRATLNRQQKEPDYQFSMPLPIKAHPSVTEESSINKIQKKSDEFHTSIGDLAPEEENTHSNSVIQET